MVLLVGNICKPSKVARFQATTHPDVAGSLKDAVTVAFTVYFVYLEPGTGLIN